MSVIAATELGRLVQRHHALLYQFSGMDRLSGMDQFSGVRVLRGVGRFVVRVDEFGLRSRRRLHADMGIGDGRVDRWRDGVGAYYNRGVELGPAKAFGGGLGCAGLDVVVRHR